jgi:hypothetical protein
MSIQFHCEHCGKEILAPDEAGGRRGKCPYCEKSNFIPNPKAAEEDLELAPLDENEEQERQREIRHLLEQEKAILQETSREETTPRLSQKDASDVKAEDLHHLVVNFCLDMSGGMLERADTHVMKLNEHSHVARQAVREFLDGKVLEPALDPIPTRVREGYLKNLLVRLR